MQYYDFLPTLDIGQFNSNKPHPAYLKHFLRNCFFSFLRSYPFTDRQIYVEHGYLYDKADVSAHSSSRMRKKSLADNELVRSQTTYHSPAEVIEGRDKLNVIHVMLLLESMKRSHKFEAMILLRLSLLIKLHLSIGQISIMKLYKTMMISIPMSWTKLCGLEKIRRSKSCIRAIMETVQLSLYLQKKLSAEMELMAHQHCILHCSVVACEQVIFVWAFSLKLTIETLLLKGTQSHCVPAWIDEAPQYLLF